MEGMVGVSPALCENIGHTYNSIGNYHKADEYFTKAKDLVENNNDKGNLGIAHYFVLIFPNISHDLFAPYV